MTEMQSRQYVAHRQLITIKRNLPQAIVLSMLAAILVTAADYVLFSSVDAFYWLLALLITSAFRGLYPVKVVRDEMSVDEVNSASRVVLLSAALGGIVWGASAFFLFDSSSSSDALFLMLVLAGVCSAGLMCYAIWPASFAAFAGGVAGVGTLAMFARTPTLGYVALILAVVYIALLMMTAVRVRKAYLANLRLRLKNRDLQSQLSEQDERLEHLQTGVSKNLSFIDIAKLWSWETDASLKMTHLSHGFQKFTGLPLDCVLGHPLEKLFLEHPHSVNYRLAELYKRMAARQTLSEFEILIKRLDGSLITISINGEACFDPHRRFLGYRGTARDITNQKAQLRKLEFEASHDSLTRLINRRTFLSVLENSLTKLDGRFVPFLLAFIDLERLNIVNDTAGHMAGDEFLAGLSQQLLAFQTEHVRIARIGGDEFGLVVAGQSEDEAVILVHSVLETIRGHRFSHDGRNYAVGAFAGLVYVADNSVDAYSLMQQANQACHKARESRDGMHKRLHSMAEGRGTEGDAHSVQRMFDALDNQRFVLSYQPVAANDGSVAHFEVLLAQLTGDGASYSSGQFIPAIERFGAMGQFDRWVIEESFRQYSTFAARFPEAGLFINLSGSNLDDASLFDFIREKLAAYSVPRERVCFEITETSAVSDAEKAALLIKGLRSGGCRFALDDFGTGMASLNYLKLFPVDYVKIDGSFVRGLKDSVVDQAVLKTIADLSQALEFEIIAESVEDLQLLPLLREFGVSYFQGYGVARPQLLDDWVKDTGSPVDAMKVAG